MADFLSTNDKISKIFHAHDRRDNEWDGGEEHASAQLEFLIL